MTDRAAPLTLDSFLAEAVEFRLGDLVTEQPHPLTGALSELALHDVPSALKLLLEVDRLALDRLLAHTPVFGELQHAIAATLRERGRIYICGCGATGRLALSLEAFWRQVHPEAPDAVVSLMAGGDAALVRSIEGFEDHPGYGARHLDELGFGPADLFVGVTEGGETPYVLGAAERGAELSRQPAWLLYCNPDNVLLRYDRCRRVIESVRIRTVSLPVGQMALAGSTRMQATTALMLAVGLPLLEGSPAAALTSFRRRLDALDPAPLVPLIEDESAAYQRGDYLRYEADRHAITVFTDTTERAPTFNMTPFENALEYSAPSLSTLVVPGTRTSAEAWHALLGRRPRPLEWEGQRHLTGRVWLHGFDFSPNNGERDHLQQHVFRVSREGDALTLSLSGQRAAFDVAAVSLLLEHVLLKLLLNMHSTLVMGRLRRYERNVMTWVRPSNRKLVDRAIRYVDELVRARGGPALPYAELAALCFAEMAALGDNESIVNRTVARVLASLAAGG